MGIDEAVRRPRKPDIFLADSRAPENYGGSSDDPGGKKKQKRKIDLALLIEPKKAFTTP